MSSRIGGLIFIGLGAGVFVGINASLLPAQTIWLGLALAGFGFVRFMKANRRAMRVEERRLEKALNPRLDLIQAKAFNERTPKRLDDLGVAALEGRQREAAMSISDAIDNARPEELTLYEVDDAGANPVTDDFKISSDVSFPIEVQENRNLSEEIARLRQLHEDGIITAEEFHIAKAKLLG